MLWLKIPKSIYNMWSEMYTFNVNATRLNGFIGRVVKTRDLKLFIAQLADPYSSMQPLSGALSLLPVRNAWEGTQMFHPFLFTPAEKGFN